MMNLQLGRLLENITELARKDDHDGALRLAEKIIRDYPGESQVWIKRAYVYARDGDYRRAVDDASRAIELNSMEPDYFYTRGRYYLALSEYSKAVVDFTTTLELCEHYQDDYYREPAHFMRAEARLKLGRVEEARADLRHVRDDFTTWVDVLRSKQAMLDECASQ